MGSALARWVSVPIALGIAGVTGSVATFLGLSLFPAGVRVSGYTITHNFDIAVYGGAFEAWGRAEHQLVPDSLFLLHACVTLLRPSPAVACVCA